MQRKLGIDSYMICHGYSGLIEICSLFKRLLNTKSLIHTWKNLMLIVSKFLKNTEMKVARVS